MVEDIALGDVLRLRKVHPCGGYEWEVVRLGADIGIRCLECDRRVLLSRSALAKRTRTVISKRQEP